MIRIPFLISSLFSVLYARPENDDPPPSYPTVVDVGVFIVDFGGISQSTDDNFRLDAWLIFRWRDHRLNETHDGEYDISSDRWYYSKKKLTHAKIH